jgi:hypothetical protein
MVFWNLNRNTMASHFTSWHWTVVATLVITGSLLIMVSATAAKSSTWYLMAPDEKILSNPGVAIRMEHGPVVGPLQFTSRGEFPSRGECEPARQKLVTKWRQLSVIKRGSWDKYGFTSPSVFVRCVPADDPQLKRSREGTNTPPWMETFVNRPTRLGR